MSAYPDWHRQALAAGFVLLMLILTVNVSARFILSRSRPSRAR
jgi:phosphate transport system permease protein